MNTGGRGMGCVVSLIVTLFIWALIALAVWLMVRL